MTKRIYLDYNSTSPLAESVQSFLSSGDFFFGNPSSIHASGKKAKRYIRETKDYLLDLFGLSPRLYQVLFHSGVTEAINLFAQSFAYLSKLNKKPATIICSSVDHSAMTQQKDLLELLGAKVLVLDVDPCGNFDLDKVIKIIQSETASGRGVYFNFTWVNNETGIVWPLCYLEAIKASCDCFIHVDAVQAPGKIDEWNYLNSSFDAMTFSGHKFGSLKGVGFSLIKEDIKIFPLICGGGQQRNLRSGTLNAIGIYSLKLAFEDLKKIFLSDELSYYKNLLEEKLLKIIGSKGLVVGRNAQFRNLNTINVVIFNQKANNMLMAFDLSGIDISSGSACSSGLVEASRVLQSMGYSKEVSKGSLRFSLPFAIDKNEFFHMQELILTTLKRFL